MNKTLSKHSLPKRYGIVEANLDSLNKELKADTISFNKIDAIVSSLQKNQEAIKRIISEQEELQKRVRIRQINDRLSDSIMKQIESILKKIEIKKNYSIEKKLVTTEGKILTYGGKIVALNEKVYNDMYTIDSLEVFPILKKVNFKSNTELKELNYYIDSVEIHFRVRRNIGKAKNNEPDSLLFIIINPLNNVYTHYRYFINHNNERTAYLDSIFFIENSISKISLDFPNINSQDSTVCFDFLLRRGIISSYCISFN